MDKVWTKGGEGEGSNYDYEKAALLLGKNVLISITVNDSNDRLIRNEQYYGAVVEVDEKSGITISLKGFKEGQVFKLPPATHAFHQADRGSYTLKETGEEVVDPDFTSAWTLTEPHPENKIGRAHV